MEAFYSPFFYYLLFEFIANDSTLYRCIARATIYDITFSLTAATVTCSGRYLTVCSEQRGGTFDNRDCVSEMSQGVEVGRGITQ